MSEEEPQGIKVPIEWRCADSIVSRYANNLVVQQTDHEFITQQTYPVLSAQVSTWTIPKRQLMLQGEIAPGWSVVGPLVVNLEQEEDGYCLISDEEFAVYGDGETPLDALGDYVISLIDYYQLVTAQVEGNPANRALLQRIQAFLRPTPTSYVLQAA